MGVHANGRGVEVDAGGGVGERVDGCGANGAGVAVEFVGEGLGAIERAVVNDDVGAAVGRVRRTAVRPVPPAPKTATGAVAQVGPCDAEGGGDAVEDGGVVGVQAPKGLGLIAVDDDGVDGADGEGEGFDGGGLFLEGSEGRFPCGGW